MQPYVVLIFGGPVLAGTGRGIVGSKHDPHILWVRAECVALDIASARKLKGQVVDALIDFCATGAGPIEINGGYSDTIISQDTFPIRFNEVARFSFRYNLASL